MARALRLHRRVKIVVAVVGAVGVAAMGCSERGARESAASNETSTSPTTGDTTATSELVLGGGPPGEGCVTPEDAAAPVRLEASDGIGIGGLILGEGPVGVVVMHEFSGESLCDWLPVGRRIGDAGHRVLLIDSRGVGSSEHPSTQRAYYDWELDLLGPPSITCGAWAPNGSFWWVARTVASS